MILASSTKSVKKLPTLMGIILVVVLVGVVAVTTSLSQKVTNLFSQADTSLTPVGEVGIANITDTSFTVYWSTQGESLGAVYFGKSSQLGDGVAVDDRNLSSPSAKFATHFVRVANLKAGTKYYFRVNNVSPSTTPAEIVTGPTLNSASTQEPIYGKVVDQNSFPISGALVYWEVSGFSKVVALTKTDGTFVLPINLSRKTDLTSYAVVTPGTSEKITVSYSLENTEVTCRIGEDKPLPDIVLGSSGDCATKSKTKASGFGSIGTSNSPQKTNASLVVNLKDGESLSPLPTFTGKAGANQMVKLAISSPASFTGTVRADINGSWSWAPPTNMLAGDYTLTVSVTNLDSTTQEIKRNFKVTADLPILPNSVGTPAANPTHRSCVNSSCVSLTGTGSDSCLLDSDCAPIVISTPSATPSAPVIPSKPPETGALENTMLLILGGIVLVGVGALLAF